MPVRVKPKRAMLPPVELRFNVETQRNRERMSIGGRRGRCLAGDRRTRGRTGRSSFGSRISKKVAYRTGLVTVENGATLEVADSGTVTLSGSLALADGASLGFNFTNRRTSPVLACANAPTGTTIIVK